MPTVMMTMILGMRNRDLLGWAIFHPHFPLITLMTQAKRSSDNLAAANKKIYIWGGETKNLSSAVSCCVDLDCSFLWTSYGKRKTPQIAPELLHSLTLHHCIKIFF